MDTHEYSTIYCASCGHPVHVPVRCGLRFCSVCSASAAGRARSRLQWIINNFEKQKRKRWKFLTLTLRSTEDLSKQLEHLISSFRKLRNRRLWKDSVTGGLYVVELTHSPKGWHCHLHVIMQSSYIPQYHLSRVWNAISGSPVVDIREVKNNGLATYLTQYLTKCDVPLDHRNEAEDAMRGRRMWSPFGLAHDLNCQYKPQPAPCPCCGCEEWMSDWRVNQLWREHRAGAQYAPG